MQMRGHMAVSLTPSGSRASKAFPTHPGRTWGDGSLTRALLTPSLSPPPHHGSLLPGARLPLALDLDTLAHQRLLLPLPQASWALSAPTLLLAPALCTVAPHPCVWYCYQRDPLVLGTGEHPLPKIDLQELVGGGQMDSWVCDLLWERGSRVAKEAVSWVGSGPSPSAATKAT